MKVYRYEIENYTNNTYLLNPGPYCANIHYTDERSQLVYELQYELLSKHSNNPNNPCIRTEGVGRPYLESSMFCGCDSLVSLMLWFKDFNVMILKAGFNLVEYEVTEFMMGKSGKQVVFDHKDIINRKVLK